MKKDIAVVQMLFWKNLDMNLMLVGEILFHRLNQRRG
jgi:hypothetical protein